MKLLQQFEGVYEPPRISLSACLWGERSVTLGSRTTRQRLGCIGIIGLGVHKYEKVPKRHGRGDHSAEIGGRLYCSDAAAVCLCYLAGETYKASVGLTRQKFVDKQQAKGIINSVCW